MSADRRKSPKSNVSAVELTAWLDQLSSLDHDVDGKTRLYINNVHPDPIMKRELRRYRNGQVRSLRPVTVQRVLTYFNLKLEDMPHGKS